MENKRSNSKQNLIIILLSILILLVIVVLVVVSNSKKTGEQKEITGSTTEITEVAETTEVTEVTETTEVAEVTETTEVVETTEVEQKESANDQEQKISELVSFYTTEQIRAERKNNPDIISNGLSIYYEDGWKFWCLSDGKDPERNYMHFVAVLYVLKSAFQNFECDITLMNEVKSENKEVNFYKITWKDGNMIQCDIPSIWEEYLVNGIMHDEYLEECKRISNDVVEAMGKVMKKCAQQGKMDVFNDVKDEYKVR